MQFKYSILVLTCCLALANSLYAQRKVEQLDPEKTEEAKQKQAQNEKEEAKLPKWFDKLSYGGNVGAYFSSGGSMVNLQPTLFYRYTDNTIGGIGGSYYYWSRTYATGAGNQTYSDDAFGFNLFVRQIVFDGIFAHAEYMPLNYNVYDASTRKISKQWVDAFLVGAGTNNATSKRSGFYFAVLYDLLYDVNKSLSATPLHLRTGFYF
jgi:hypothetical protein